MKLKDVLSALVVLCVVVVVIILATATANKNQPLDSGWVTVITLTFGAALGVKEVARSRQDDPAAPPASAAPPTLPPSEPPAPGALQEGDSSVNP